MRGVGISQYSVSANRIGVRVSGPWVTGGPVVSTMGPSGQLHPPAMVRHSAPAHASGIELSFEVPRMSLYQIKSPSPVRRGGQTVSQEVRLATMCGEGQGDTILLLRNLA